ncbi:unnamed protein product [Allacma fusca]|uniref:Uncharacterized protein n=1 Tax=Allacma fusca TaxID=39272 RepID=A0A8J2LD03_9HEXA|nr:unnamed protein product [Allacma fusca]
MWQELPTNLLDQNELFSCFTVKCVEISNTRTSERLPQKAANPGVLQHLQIVPTCQPLLSMNKGLKTFNITIDHVLKFFSGNLSPALSCVRGYLVFSRTPDLKVTVELNWPDSSTPEFEFELDLCCSGDTFPDLRKFVRFSPEVAFPIFKEGLAAKAQLSIE